MSHDESSSSGYPPSMQSVQSGLLFGRPLLELMCPADALPQPLLVSLLIVDKVGFILDKRNDVSFQQILTLIFRDGVFIEGIFRKAPNYRILKDVRRKLDEGVAVDFTELQPTVAASLLKVANNNN